MENYEKKSIIRMTTSEPSVKLILDFFGLQINNNKIEDQEDKLKKRELEGVAWVYKKPKRL